MTGCKKIFIVLLMPAFLAVAAGTAGFSEGVRLAPNVDLCLPEGSQIQIDWISPPADQSLLQGRDLCFSIDDEGLPWIGIGDRLIVDPARNVNGLLSVPFRVFFHLDTGGMMIAAYDDFGYIHPAEDPEFDEETGMLLFPYQPIALMPYGGQETGNDVVDRKMFRGGDCLFFVVERQLAENQNLFLTEVFRLQPAGIPIRAFEPVLSSGEPVAAVAGDSDLVFVARGNSIFKIEPGSPDPVLLYEHPTDAIVALQYSRESGLFYATGSAVGIASEESALEFLKTPRPIIFLREGSLYVMFSENAGIIRIANAGYLRPFNRPVREVTAVDGRPLRGRQEIVVAGLIGLLLDLGLFVLLVVALVDVLKHSFSGPGKIGWVLMIFLGFLAWSVTLLPVFLGFAPAVSAGMRFINLLILLVYFIFGKKQRIRA